MGKSVGVFYDQGGNPIQIVSASDAFPSNPTIVIDEATYDALPPPLNINGSAVYQDLNEYVVAQLSGDPTKASLVSAIQSNIDAVQAILTAQSQAEGT